MAGIEETFDQLWAKARFEEAKLRDLSSRDENGRFSGSKSTLVRPDNHYYGQSNTTSHKCFVCYKVGHLTKDCPQQKRGKSVESPVDSSNSSHNTSLKLVVHTTLPVS